MEGGAVGSAAHSDALSSRNRLITRGVAKPKFTQPYMVTAFTIYQLTERNCSLTADTSIVQYI